VADERQNQRGHPRLIRTAWTSGWGHAHDMMKDRAPLGRSGEPEETMQRVILAVAASKILTGEGRGGGRRFRPASDGHRRAVLGPPYLGLVALRNGSPTLSPWLSNMRALKGSSAVPASRPVAWAGPWVYING